MNIGRARKNIPQANPVISRPTHSNSTLELNSIKIQPAKSTKVFNCKVRFLPSKSSSLQDNNGLTVAPIARNEAIQEPWSSVMDNFEPFTSNFGNVGDVHAKLQPTDA